MADEPLQYHSLPPKSHSMARIAAFGLAVLYLLGALAVAVGMTTSAYLDRNNGPENFGLTNPFFYLVLILFTAVLAAVAWAFFWAGKGIARRAPARLLLGKYLALLNLVLVGIEAAGITVGIFADPPKGTDRIIAFSAIGFSVFVLAALLFTMILFERAAKDIQKEKEPES